MRPTDRTTLTRLRVGATAVVAAAFATTWALAISGPAHDHGDLRLVDPSGNAFALAPTGTGGGTPVVAEGQYRFELERGEGPHSFLIARADADSSDAAALAVAARGEDGEAQATSLEAGDYVLWCITPGHESDMRFEVSVR